MILYHFYNIFVTGVMCYKMLYTHIECYTHTTTISQLLYYNYRTKREGFLSVIPYSSRVIFKYIIQRDTENTNQKF